MLCYVSYSVIRDAMLYFAMLCCYFLISDVFIFLFCQYSVNCVLYYGVAVIEYILSTLAMLCYLLLCHDDVMFLLQCYLWLNTCSSL